MIGTSVAWARPGAAPTALHDGSHVWIRPIQRTDGPLLADGFARLSLESRRFRFLGSKPELTAADLRYFTQVDHHHHEALVAVSLDGRAVGTARYIRDADDARSADVAVTVVDEWHRRGVATALIAALIARAVAANISHFTAHIAEDNLAILRLLQRAGADVEVVEQASGVLVYRVAILRRAARSAGFGRPRLLRPARRDTNGPQWLLEDGCRGPIHGELIPM